MPLAPSSTVLSPETKGTVNNSLDLSKLKAFAVAKINVIEKSLTLSQTSPGFYVSAAQGF